VSTSIEIVRQDEAAGANNFPNRKIRIKEERFEMKEESDAISPIHGGVSQTKETVSW
jgi:hypothetical protein